MSDTARGNHPAGRGIPRLNKDLILRLLAFGFTPDHDHSSLDISAWSYPGIEGTLLLPAIRVMSDQCSEMAVRRASSHIGLPVHEFWSAPILMVITSEDESPLSAEELLELIAPDRSLISPDLVSTWLSTTDQLLSLVSSASN